MKIFEDLTGSIPRITLGGSILFIGGLIGLMICLTIIIEFFPYSLLALLCGALGYFKHKRRNL